MSVRIYLLALLLCLNSYAFTQTSVAVKPLGNAQDDLVRVSTLIQQNDFPAATQLLDQIIKSAKAAQKKTGGTSTQAEPESAEAINRDSQRKSKEAKSAEAINSDSPHKPIEAKAAQEKAKGNKAFAGQAKADGIRAPANSQTDPTDQNAVLAKSYTLYGNIYLMQRQFDLALQNYLQSLAYADPQNHPAETGKVYTNIGTVYSLLKNRDKGKEYYLKALQINPAANADRLKTLINLAGLYADGDEDQKAVHTFNTAITLARSLQDKAMEAVIQTNLGNFYLKKKQWQKSIAASTNSLHLRDELKQPLSVITLNNLGYALAQTGNYPQAISYYQKALPSANAMEQKQLFNNLYQAEKAVGHLAPALKFLERYSTLNDSLNTLNYNNKVASLTAQYEAVKKQQTINTLQKSNTEQQAQLRQQQYLIIAGILILLLSSVVIYMRVKNNNVKNALEKSQIRRQLLLLQLNPHFIFNALQSVQQYIYNKDQQRSAAYLNSFSRLIRLVLENSDRDMISLDQEIEMLNNYLQLQQSNSPSPFEFTIKVDEDIETEMIQIPVMMLQPYVENAVVHGVKDKQDGKIAIHVQLINNNLEVAIRDNGVFSQSSSSANTLHRSMAMQILEQRIKELNRNQQQVALSVTHHNSSDNAYPGTHVNFKFTLPHE